jgi:mono/diheme cytochrome c family protein
MTTGMLLSVLVLITTAIIFWVITLRALRAGNSLLKWGGALLGGLLALVLTLTSGLAAFGLYKSLTPRQAAVPDLSVAGTPEQIARGEHIADTFCASCHSPDTNLPLVGGRDIGKDFPMDLGIFVSANLTPAGRIKDWSDGELFRAIRNGIAQDGRWLAIMSNARGRNLSDEDLQAVIAYLRSQSPVENDLPDPPDQANLLGLIMLGAGMLPEGKPPTEAAITAPEMGATVAYGEYILSYQDCRDCHGEDLRGGVEGQLPPIGPDLRLVKGWTQEQFMSTLRTGVDPSGHTLSIQMPWQNIGRMEDEELVAMYSYLVSLP